MTMSQPPYLAMVFPHPQHPAPQTDSREALLQVAGMLIPELTCLHLQSLSLLLLLPRLEFWHYHLGRVKPVRPENPA
jgi:hypothetical protein